MSFITSYGKRISSLLILLSLLNCKTTSEKTVQSLLGQFHVGPKCQPLPEDTSIYKTHTVTFNKFQKPDYFYQGLVQLYLEQDCLIPDLTLEYKGRLKIQQTSEMLPQAKQIELSEIEFKASIKSLAMLNRANLQSAKYGVQGTEARLCNLKEEWSIGQEFDVTNSPCSLGLSTTKKTGYKQILYITANSKALQFGFQDTRGKSYPVALDEDPNRAWRRTP